MTRSSSSKTSAVVGSLKNWIVHKNALWRQTPTSHPPHPAGQRATRRPPELKGHSERKLGAARAQQQAPALRERFGPCRTLKVSDGTLMSQLCPGAAQTAQHQGDPRPRRARALRAAGARGRHARAGVPPRPRTGCTQPQNRPGSGGRKRHGPGSARTARRKYCGGRGAGGPRDGPLERSC